MRIIYSYLISKLKYQSQYRMSAFLGVITQLIWGLLLIRLYLAFYQSNPAAFPLPFSSLVAYLWLQQAFFNLVTLWNWDYTILDSTKNGKVAYELLRPASLYLIWFANLFGSRMSTVLYKSTLLILTALLLPAPYKLIFPNSLALLGLFVLSLLLGTLLCVALSLLIYFISFFLLDSLGIRILYQSLGELLMGAVVPLPFLPDSWQHVLNLLPFASICNTPYLIYGAQQVNSIIVGKILLQFLWLAVMIILGKGLEKHMITKAVIQGG